jgi:hypothetical protein
MTQNIIMLKQNTAHKATQVIEDALYTRNTVQKEKRKEKDKAIHVTCLGSLLG